MLNLFNPDNYTFTLYGLPVFMVGVAIISLGFYVLVRERLSTVGASFLFLCLNLGLYLVFSAMTFASPGIDNAIALFWSRIANLGVVWIPTSILSLILVLLGLSHKYRLAIAASAVVSTLFSFGLLFTDLFIRRIEQFFWGKYSQYGPLGYAFVIYFFVIMLTILPLLWHAQQHAETDRQKKRYRGLLIAFIGGYLGSADFLPAFGVPIYPFGYLSVGFFIAVNTYVILRYRLVDITPELAAGQILETMQGAVIVTSMDGTVRVMNKVAEEILGCTRSELISSNIMGRIPVPQDFLETVKAGKSTAACEMVWQGKQSTYHVRLSASLLFDRRASDPVGIVYVASDITQNIKALESVHLSEERLRLAHSAAGQGWFDLNVPTGETVVSPEHARMLGYDPAEFTTNLQIWFDNIHPDDRSGVRHAYQECLITGGPATLEYRRKTKTGEWKWISSTGKVVEYDAEHKPLRMIGVHADITARKRAEYRLDRLMNCFLTFGIDPEENIRRLTALCGELMEATCALYSRLEGGMLCSIGMWQTPADYRPVDRPEGHICYDVIRQGGDSDLFIVHNLPATPYFTSDPNVSRYGLITYIGKAVSFAGSTIGTLCVVYQKEYLPDESDTKFVSIIASAIGIEEHRRYADSALRESEARFRSLFEKVHVVALVIDPTDGAIVDANPAASAFYGWSHDELLARKITDINTLSRDAVRVEMEAAKNEKRSYFLFKHRRADGSIREVEVYSGPIQSGGKTLLYSIVHDITARKNVEAEREQFYKFFKTSADIMVIADPNGAFLKTNPACTEILGYSADELVARPFVDFIHPDDKQPTLDEMERQQKKGFSLNFENRYQCKDGSFKWLSWRATYVRNEGITYATARDITQQKWFEEELRKSKTATEMFFSVVPDLLCIASTDGYFKVINDVWEKTLGYKREELLSKPFTSFIHPDDVVSTRNEINRQIQGSETIRFTNRYVCKDGTFRWLEWNATPAIGGVIYADARDITIRKMTELALQESEQKYRSIIDNISDTYYRTDQFGRILFVSPSAVTLLGFTNIDEIIGMNISSLWQLPDKRSHMIEKIRSEGSVKDYEVVFVRKDGSPITVSISSKFYIDESGNEAGVEGVIRDITARKRVERDLVEKTRQLEDLTRTLEQRVREEVALRSRNEQMLVQQTKMAAMGEMLGAIAHQWRQPLNALGLIIQNISDAHAHGELDREYIDDTVRRAMSQIRHMSVTIDDFRNFFQPDRDRTTFDAMAAVGRVLALFSAQLAANEIDFELTCRTHGKSFRRVEEITSCPGKTVTGYQNEFEHVVMNLINNAREAVLESQQSGITTASVRGMIAIEFRNEDDAVLIEISDNGGGIAEGILDRIFEPYFTTKGPAKGTGLGLYMSKVIIEDHMQGGLTARNGARGAIFTIRLERGPQDAAANKEEQGPS